MKKALLGLATLIIILSGSSYAQDWTYISNTGTTHILYGMSFPPGQSTVGYACGMQYTSGSNGVIVKTVDGGDNWTQIWPVSGTVSGLYAIWFTSEQVGFACGYNNYFIKTTDAGATWNPITVGTGVWYYRDMEFRDANNGIAVASMDPFGPQAAFITSDGGVTWTPSTSGMATNEVIGVSYASQNVVYAVGTSNHVFKSVDGGHNWITNNTLSAMLLGVNFADNSFGVAGGEETMFATNNGGSTWSSFSTGYENFYATKAFTNGTAYIGGTDENIYFTTNYGQNWTMNFNGPGTSTLYRIRSLDNGTLFACGSQGKIMKQAPLLNADFTADPTLACTGGTVNFDDESEGDIDSWSWTFEGGTPPTSTQENPVVTYNTAGTFDVQLTVTSGSNSNTETKADYITVYQGVAQPVTPSGPAEVCGALSYEYTTQAVQYAESYDWEVTPSSAGTITGDGIAGTFMASNSWSGTYVIKVRAESDCGYGPWSPDFTGTLYHSPVEFGLTGDGAFCEGMPGAEVGLDGSETGVDYELFKNNVTTGTIETGTGSPISFGLFTETGIYTVVASAGNCTENMLGEVYVHMLPAPGQAAIPEGDTEVCNNEISNYSTSGADNAEDYIWSLVPPEAGALTPDGDEVTIAWSSGFFGSSSLTVQGVNDCGDGMPSQELEITVNASPEPAVTGLALVCDNDESDYTTLENAGSSYAWEVSGGTITSGAGTWQVTVAWGNPGSGSVSVTELTSQGCEAASENFEVTIDDCTGTDELQAGDFKVYPNPANEKVHVTGLKEANISIYNILGIELSVIYGVNGDQLIDISSFENGVYIIKIEQNSAVSAVRLMVR